MPGVTRSAGWRHGVLGAGALLALLAVWLLLRSAPSEEPGSAGPRTSSPPQALVSDPSAPTPTDVADVPTGPAGPASAPPSAGPGPGPIGLPGLAVRLHLELEDEPLAGVTLAFSRQGERVAFSTDPDGDAELALSAGLWTLEVPASLAGRAGPFSLRAYPPLTDPGARFRHVPLHERLVLEVLAAAPPPPPPVDPGQPLSFEDPEPAGTVVWDPRDAAGTRRVRLELEPPLALRVRVLGAEGAPLAGAWVGAARGHAAPETGLRARTDADGWALLRLPAAWQEVSYVAVHARAAGLGGASAWASRRGEDEGDDEDDEPPRPAQEVAGGRVREGWDPLELRLGAALAFSGTVCDPAGRGLPARLEVVFSLDRSGERPQVRLEGTCDAEGRFLLEGIAAGAGREASPGPRWAQVLLRAELEGFLPAQEEVLVGPGASPVRLTLVPAQPIEVLVRGADGAPLAGARVAHAPGGFYFRPSAWQRDEVPVTDAEGRLRLEGLPAWTFLAVWAEDHVAELFEVRLPLPLLELPLTRGGRLVGRVTGLPPGTHDAEVEAAYPGEHAAAPRTLQAPGLRRVEAPAPVWPVDRALCDGEGRFELRGLPLGLELEVAWLGIGVRARAGDPGVEIDSAGSGWGELRLIAVEAGGGAPLPCEVELVSGVARVSRWSWGDGDALAQRIEAASVKVKGQGPLELLIRAEGHVPARVRAVLAAGQELDLGQLPLTAGARLACAPTWPDVPVRGLRVSWSAPALQLGGQETLPAPASPEVRLVLTDGLPVGTPVALRVELLPWERAAPARTVLETTLTLRAGETRTLALELR